MSLKRWIRNWLNNENIYASQSGIVEANPQPSGARATIVRIENGWLLEHVGSTRFVAELDDIPKELPGLIAGGKMRQSGQKERY